MPVFSSTGLFKASVHYCQITVSHVGPVPKNIGLFEVCLLLPVDCSFPSPVQTRFCVRK